MTESSVLKYSLLEGRWILKIQEARELTEQASRQLLRVRVYFTGVCIFEFSRAYS